MFKHEDLQIFGRRFKKNVSNFHPRENMGRGSKHNFNWMNFNWLI